MKMLIDFEDLHGDTEEGNILFLVTVVDTEDPEDTTTNVWVANDEEHLYDLVKEEFVGDDEDEDEDEDEDPIARNFENDWGINILFQEIGQVQKQY
jgi:hypothetical protein